MQAERKKRTGIMLCYPFEEKRLARWEAPYIVQPKLDGVRCRAVPTSKGYVLLSSTEELIVSVPHINEALDQSGFSMELDGELYLHGSSFEDIVSVTARTVNYHPEFAAMEYHVFDVVNESIQLGRSLWLAGQHKNFKKPLAPVPTYITHSLDDIMERYVQFLNTGYEGIIVRHFALKFERKRSTFMMKFKPKKSDWYTVTGYKEEIDKHGDPKGRLGALICCGDDGTEFSVGSGLDDSQRSSYWADRDRLVGSLCHVQYQHITPGKRVPRFPVFVEVS